MPQREEEVAVQEVGGGAAGRRRHPAHGAQRQRLGAEEAEHLPAHARRLRAAAADPARRCLPLRRPLLLLLLLLRSALAAWVGRAGGAGLQFDYCHMAIPAAHLHAHSPQSSQGSQGLIIRGQANLS